MPFKVSGHACNVSLMVFLSYLYLCENQGVLGNYSIPKRGDVDYCNMPAPMCEIHDPEQKLTHVMCKYPNPGPSKKCAGYESDPIIGVPRTKILMIHNNIRNEVAMGKVSAQPSAANMLRISWDDELARFAQRWVDQCVSLSEPHHDTCRDTMTTWVGQNVGVVVHDKDEKHVNADELVGDFFDQVKHFDKKSIAKFDGDPVRTGDYVQLVWAETNAIGCAQATYNLMIEGSKQRHTRLVCNYSPAGLTLNDPVYAVGPPCSKCPNGTTCGQEYPGLCATEIQKQDSSHNQIQRSIGWNDWKAKPTRKGLKTGIFTNGRCYCPEVERSYSTSLSHFKSMIYIIMLFHIIYRIL